MPRFGLFATFSVVLASCTPSRDVPKEARVDALSSESSTDTPRGLMLELPLEHAGASGSVRSMLDHSLASPVAYAGPGQPPLPLFLNRNGGTYYPGVEDSRQNTSIVPRRPSTLSPYGGSDEDWSRIVDCISTMFAPYNVVIVEDEPVDGEYIEAAIGGFPGEVGLGRGTAGVAPVDRYECTIIPNAVVYIFSGVYGDAPQATCETAAQEIGHALSLDHEFYCPDPMTYLGGCGDKVFRDHYAECGEYSARACSCGRPSQNSVFVLNEKLGESNGVPPPTMAEDPVSPTISIALPAEGAVLTANSTITVEATVEDNFAIRAAELVWSFNESVYPCPYNGSGGAVTCERQGSRYTWRLLVGSGDRAFSVRARDTAGNETETPARMIHLGEPSSPIADQSAPSAEIISPQNGEVLSANTTIQVRARVQDDQGLASVDLVWSNGQSLFPCPFTGQEVSCRQEGDLYVWALKAGVGTRKFVVRAVDLGGNITETSERTIELSTAPDQPPSRGADIVAEDNDSAGDAFPATCGNAIDLVVSSDDEDWFAFDAPAGVVVDLDITAPDDARLTVELRTSDGATVLGARADETRGSGAVRAVSTGPKVLARIATTSPRVPYRLAALCLGTPGSSRAEDTNGVKGAEPPTLASRPTSTAEVDGRFACTGVEGSSTPAQLVLLLGLACLLRRRARS